MRSRMRSTIRPALVALLGLASAAACDGTGGNDDGGATDQAPGAATIDVNWSLLTANLQGGVDNGFALDCDKAGATGIRFQLQDESSQTVTTGMTPCPAGQATGAMQVPLPKANQPYTLSATLVGVPKSVSERVKSVMVGGPTYTLRIYAQGCDSPACL